MKNARCSALVLMVTGASMLAMAGDVLAQSGAAGTGSGTSSIESGRPGSATDADKGPGVSRDNAPAVDQPDSGQRSSHGMGMPQVPAGIGERGTGQTQSTLERSGGQSRSSQGMASGNDQSRIPQAMAPLPPSE